jgi:hypothetical protein
MTAFAEAFVAGLAERCLAASTWRELPGTDGGPRMSFQSPGNGDDGAGYLKLWRASEDSGWDRMIHARLAADTVDTNLFFLFARAQGVLPHFHGQAVQFGGDQCVYNADLLPRLDPVDHPGYFRAVFEPLNRPYWEVTQRPENAAASAPGNPAIAVYLSPWSIGAGRPAPRDELERVSPQIHAYLEHCLALADTLDYPAPDAELMLARDRRHLASFFDERLDRRAWKGVYRILGEEQGRAMRSVLMQNLHD